MKKLSILLIVASSLQAMQPQPTANSAATDTVAANSQPTAGAAAQTTDMQTDTPPFKFHLGIPSLLRKAAARTTPEAAESGYQEQLALQDQIQKQLELGTQLQGAEKARNDTKVAELKEQRKVIPWSILEETQEIPEDTSDEIINALEKDNPDLLKMALEERDSDPFVLKPLFDPETKIPLPKAITLNDFINLARQAAFFNAKRCLNFLLSRAENIPLQTLDKLLTYANSTIISSDIIQLFINRGARGEFFSQWNDFPLHLAVVENKLEKVTELIDEKADVNQLANDMTPLMLVCQYGNNDTSFEITKKLLEKNAEVNAQNSDKWTPLLLASANGHTAIAKLLIENGANVNAQGYDKWTPLFFASEKGYVSLAELLIKYGADVNAKNTAGLTPLHIASQNNHLSVIKLLLKNHADVEATNNEGFTALHIASVIGHTAVAQLLIENGADVNSQGPLGLTSLHMAVSNNHPDIVKIFINHGADVNAQNNGGWAPLHSAAKNNNSETALLLLEHKADPRIKTRSKQTALDILEIPRAEPTDISRLRNILEAALVRKQAEVAAEEADALSRKRAKTDADEQAQKTPVDVSSFFAAAGDDTMVVLPPSTRTKRPAPETDTPNKKTRKE